MRRLTRLAKFLSSSTALWLCARAVSWLTTLGLGRHADVRAGQPLQYNILRAAKLAIDVLASLSEATALSGLLNTASKVGKVCAV